MGLTARFVETVQPPETGRRDFWDDDPKGLSLRVWRDGKGNVRKVWNLAYRSGGKWCRYRIGDFSRSLGLKEARKRARDLKRDIADGINPNDRKREARRAEQEAAAKAQAMTVREAVAEYIDSYAKKNHKDWKQTEQKLRHALPIIGDKPIAEVTRGDIHAVLDPIIARDQLVLANRVRSYLNMLFGWCVGRGYVEVPPTYKLPKPLKREEARDRVLTEAEIRDFWRATFQMGYPFGPFFRLLLLTGQRRTEVSHMGRPELDDAAAPTLWTIPGERTKNKLAHEVPLAPMAKAEIEALPRFTTAEGEDFHYLLTSGYVGDRPISGYEKAKQRLDKYCRPSEWSGDWTLHDLRRTFRTGLSQCGVDPHIAERCVNHIDGGVRRVYDRHAYREEKRRAFEAWERRLAEILEPKKQDGGNVVRLAR